VHRRATGKMIVTPRSVRLACSQVTWDLTLTIVVMLSACRVGRAWRVPPGSPDSGC
jgi:hypothetical protein